MGLQVNGRNVAAMRINWRDAVEARCNGSVVWPVGEPPGDDRLRFVAEEAGSTITMVVAGGLTTVPVLEYSLDDGRTWTEFYCDNAPVITLANVGDTVWMRGDNTTFAIAYNRYAAFRMSGKIAAMGSIEYLRSKSGTVTALADYCYVRMFYGCTSLTAAPNLPATTLSERCYAYMFYGCTGLTAVPALTATTLAYRCCEYMFRGCTGLTAAPELPATTLAEYCYAYMFYECTSLTTAPELPATHLSSYCYEGMFYGCTNLTVASEIPADNAPTFCCGYMFYGCAKLTKGPTRLAASVENYCYAYMFYGCSSLTVAPELPAVMLSGSCYDSMFYGCSSLTVAPELPATSLWPGCYYAMFRGCYNLKKAPELPATDLQRDCYSYMFYDCSSLTVAPELPASVLKQYCYSYMFIGCSSISHIRVSFTAWEPSNATLTWVRNVAATGTFVCPEGLEQIVDTSHIPPGWVVEHPVPEGDFRFCVRKPPNVIQRWSFADILFTGTVIWEGGGETSYIDADESQITHNFPMNRQSFMMYQWVTMHGVFKALSLNHNSALFNINSLPLSLKSRTDFTDMFSSCIYLSVIPATLFENCISARKMVRTFTGCGSITSIPATLFDSCPNIDDFTNCFLGCSALTGNAPPLWEQFPNAVGTGCFKNCTKLSNYADIPDDWK